MINEIAPLNDQIQEITQKIESETLKKRTFEKSFSEKISLGDQLEEKLRVFTEKINQLEKIEYPGEKEREMLVSFVSK